MKLLRVLATLATLLSVVLLTRLKLSTDLTDLFPKTREADALARTTRVFGGGDVSPVLLRGTDPKRVESAARDAARALAACQTVAQVIEEVPTSHGSLDPTAAWRFAGPAARAELANALTEDGMRRRLQDTRKMLLAPGAAEIADTIARDPLRLAMIPFERRIEVAAGARTESASTAFTADGGLARLLVVEPKGRAFDPSAAKTFTAEAEETLKHVRRDHPDVRIALTGGHVIAAETETLMRGDLQKSSILSLLLAAIAFAVTFRRPRALIAVLPPLAAGTLWTTALAYFLYPQLSAIAIAFAAVVVGVGADTGVHVYGRLLEARRDGRSPDESADIARRETWRPTLTAAFAAGGAFACLALTDIEGMRQLGILCGAGEVLTALAILLVVPEIGARLERGTPPKRMSVPIVRALSGTTNRALAALSVAGCAVALAFALGVPTIDHGVVALDGQTLPSMATYEEIYATFGGTKGQLLVISADANEARARSRADAVAEVADTLVGSGVIEGFDALGTIAPSEGAQHARLEIRDALDLPAKGRLLAKVLSEEGFAPEAFEAALASFAHPDHTVSDVATSQNRAIAWVRRRHLGRDDQGSIAVTFVRLTRDPVQQAEARTLLRAADPEAVQTGYADLQESLRSAMVRDVPRILLAALSVVLLVLGFSLRSVGTVALAVLVLVVEIALVLVLANLFHIRWHIYDALVLPVLLGITLDETLFLLDAVRRQASVDKALEKLAPLAASTALTTAAGFGALLICRFGGLTDIGKVGALGSAAGLLCALIIIPAALRIWQSRSRQT